MKVFMEINENDFKALVNEISHFDTDDPISNMVRSLSKSVVLSDGVTNDLSNGQVIKMLFPETPAGVSLDQYKNEMVFSTTLSWWCDKYTGGNK